MELPEIVDFARKFSVMVKINGPDPKGLKMKNHAFHQYNSGKTTLSASGMLLPQNLHKCWNFFDGEDCVNSAVVITVASVIEPFLSQKSKVNNTQGKPELIPGAQIDVMVEVKEGMEQNLVASDNRLTKWFGAQVLRLVDVPASSAAVQSLIEASSGSLEHRWEVGWSLAPHIDSPQRGMDAIQTQGDVTTESRRTLIGQKSSDGNLMAVVATRIAILQVPTFLDKDLPEVMISTFNKRGDVLLSMGSPFGILSSLHFFNSISVGSVANCYPPMSLDRSLLMADIRCLPGMEGGPIFGQHACLIGILNRPLRQTGGAEIQVVIPWKAIEGAFNDLFQSAPLKLETRVQCTGNICDARTTTLNSSNCRALPNHMQKNPLSYYSPQLPVEQAMTSVCLVTLDNRVWASGVVLNKQGLILTNAHLLEPWRFGKTIIQTGRDETRTHKLFTLLEDSMPLRHAVDEANDVLHSNALQPPDHFPKGYRSHQVHGRISVRLDLKDSWVWSDAKVVYVSKGPLDISLLQLETVPHLLCPITMELACPSPGSQAFVIGHGLLGPRCDMFPSISSGVVAKVVKTKSDVTHPSTSHGNPAAAGEVPAMLETTASVHPGGSGGAIVNSSGHMIGLVTSNAKHGGGSVIPHMNFSIPSAALEPVFIYAKDMQNVSLLQQLDRPNKDLAAVWSMMPQISPEPGPSLVPGVDGLLLEDKEKGAKGSQFAKFINQRQELFKKPCNNNTPLNLSRDTIPSKL